MKKLITALLVLTLFSSVQAELAVWEHPYLKPMVRQEPAPASPRQALRLRTTPGEYEPAAFAVRPDRAAPVAVSLDWAEGPRALPVSWCELHVVGSLSDSTQPNRLYEFNGPVELKAGETSFFWLTVRPPADAAAGTYSSAVRVESGGEVRRLEVICEVLPFTLDRSPVIGGVFMSSTDLPAGWYADMKEHGLDAIQFFWGGTGIGMSRKGERLVLDFSRMDKFMAEVVAGGLEGPVIISLGNDHSLHYERQIAGVFDLPVETGERIDGKSVIGPAVSPRLDSLFVDGLRQIRAHWEAKAYPQELVVLIYDEPTERLLDRCKHRYDLLKTVMPWNRVYGVVMNRGVWAESMRDQCDIVVSDGAFLDCLDVARKYHKDYWVYSFPLSQVHTTRYDMGCLPWRVRAEGTFFWMYNYWGYNP
ncbi:MAG: hypothetical protein JXQ83_09115, partial [Candidatus Glassbacteria bacterium]|nr:hypothetical protein [Candidatus Glassbacteria bacterium]